PLAAGIYLISFRLEIFHKGKTRTVNDFIRRILMGRLDGKVAIITGAGSGQGAEEARLCAKEGAKVVATDIQADKVNAVAEESTGAGGEAISFNHDVTKQEDWDMVVKETVSRFGKIDILINNAGIGGAEG